MLMTTGNYPASSNDAAVNLRRISFGREVEALNCKLTLQPRRCNDGGSLRLELTYHGSAMGTRINRGFSSGDVTMFKSHGAEGCEWRPFVALQVRTDGVESWPRRLSNGNRPSYNPDAPNNASGGKYIVCEFEGRTPFETYRRDIEPTLLGDDMLGALHEVVEGDDALGYTASLLDGAAPLEAAPPLALLAPRMAMRAGVSSRTRSNGSGAAAGVLDPSAPAPPGGGGGGGGTIVDAQAMIAMLQAQINSGDGMVDMSQISRVLDGACARSSNTIAAAPSLCDGPDEELGSVDSYSYASNDDELKLRRMDQEEEQKQKDEEGQRAACGVYDGPRGDAPCGGGGGGGVGDRPPPPRSRDEEGGGDMWKRSGGGPRGGGPRGGDDDDAGGRGSGGCGGARRPRLPPPPRYSAGARLAIEGAWLTVPGARREEGRRIATVDAVEWHANLESDDDDASAEERAEGGDDEGGGGWMGWTYELSFDRATNGGGWFAARDCGSGIDESDLVTLLEVCHAVE